MEHLPECNYQKNPDRNVCICERLRACEDRVSKDFFMAGYAAGYGEETLAVSRKRGHSDALIDAREAIAEAHLPIPVIQCECGWGFNCPECGTESNQTVGFVCRVCCDDWSDHGYCDDMHNLDNTPFHHVDGETWSGPYCPVIAALDAIKGEKP
jgi:hypothetical protein